MAFPPCQTRGGLWRVKSQVQTNACLNFFYLSKKGLASHSFMSRYYGCEHIPIEICVVFFLIGKISIPCGWNQFFDWGNYWSLWPTMVLLDLLFLSFCIYHDSMWICLIFAFFLLWSQTNKYICNFCYNVKKKNTSCKLYILLLDVNFLLFCTCYINFLLPFALLPVKLCHGRLEMISFRFSTPMELHPILLFIGYHCCLFGMIY